MVVAGLVAVSMAQRPQPCYAPEQFTAKAFYTDTERSQAHERYVTITYDAVNLRRHIAEVIKQPNGMETNYSIIQFFKEGYEYEIDYYAQECKREHLRSGFTYHSVVSNATWQGDVFIGSSAVAAGSVEVEKWRAVHTASGGVSRWAGSFTRTGCVPVTTIVQYPDGHTSSETIHDVVLGIPDESIWEIDAELCPIPPGKEF